MGYTQIYYLVDSLPTYIKYLYTKKIRYQILQYRNRFKTRNFWPH